MRSSEKYQNNQNKSLQLSCINFVIILQSQEKQYDLCQQNNAKRSSKIKVCALQPPGSLYYRNCRKDVYKRQDCRRSVTKKVTAPVNNINAITAAYLIHPRYIGIVFRRTGSTCKCLCRASQSSRVSAVASAGKCSQKACNISLFSEAPPSARSQRPNRTRPEREKCFPK